MSAYKTRFILTKNAANLPEIQEMLTVEDLDTIYEGLEMLRNYSREAYNKDSEYRAKTERRCSDIQAMLYRMGE